MTSQAMFRSGIERVKHDEAREAWMRYVENLAWERGYLDQSSYFAFLRAGSLAVEAQEALSTVAARIEASGDYPKLEKLSQQLRRAYTFAWAQQSDTSYPQLFLNSQRPVFLPDYAKAFARRVKKSVDQAWLKKNSPVRAPQLLTPAEFLFSAYEFGEQVLIFSDCQSQGQQLWQKNRVCVEKEELSSFTHSHAEGVWFLANPVSGKKCFNPRQQKMSRRSEESITAFRYAVIESDCQPLDQWTRILVQLPIPIVSIISSGGKSLHALVRVDASSKDSWDEIIGAIRPRLVQLGADVGALTAVRLTRLANCYRGNRLQELLYLNPHPSDEQIWRADREC